MYDLVEPLRPYLSTNIGTYLLLGLPLVAFFRRSQPVTREVTITIHVVGYQFLTGKPSRVEVTRSVGGNIISRKYMSVKATGLSKQQIGGLHWNDIRYTREEPI